MDWSRHSAGDGDQLALAFRADAGSCQHFAPGSVENPPRREGNDYLGAAVQLALDAHVATMSLHQALDDGKAKACPVDCLLGGKAAAREGAHRYLDLVGRNARATI